MNVQLINITKKPTKVTGPGIQLTLKLKENEKKETELEQIKLKGRTDVGIVSDPLVKPKKIRVRRLSSGGSTVFTRRLLHMHSSPPPASDDKK